MKVVYKHVGLQILENDIVPFYEEVMGVVITRTFELNEEESSKIFGISRCVTIISGKLGEEDIELFVDGWSREPSYNHVCFQTSNAEQLFKKADERGYRVYKRKGHVGITFFVSDSNRNIFELKPL